MGVFQQANSGLVVFVGVQVGGRCREAWEGWKGVGGGGAWGGVNDGGVKPEEGYEYELNMLTGRWVCKKARRLVHGCYRKLFMVRTPEEVGFTVYYASDEGFRLEDGVPVWKTMERNVMEAGWHTWFYNLNYDQGRTWPSWDASGCDFETTVIRRKNVSIPYVEGRWNDTGQRTCGSGRSKAMRSWTRNGKNRWTSAKSKGTQKSPWGKERIPCEWSTWNRGKMESDNTWKRGPMKSDKTWKHGKKKGANGRGGGKKEGTQWEWWRGPDKGWHGRW